MPLLRPSYSECPIIHLVISPQNKLRLDLFVERLNMHRGIVLDISTSLSCTPRQWNARSRSNITYNTLAFSIGQSIGNLL